MVYCFFLNYFTSTFLHHKRGDPKNTGNHQAFQNLVWTVNLCYVNLHVPDQLSMVFFRTFLRISTDLDSEICCYIINSLKFNFNWFLNNIFLLNVGRFSLRRCLFKWNCQARWRLRHSPPHLSERRLYLRYKSHTLPNSPPVTLFPPLSRFSSPPHSSARIVMITLSSSTPAASTVGWVLVHCHWTHKLGHIQHILWLFYTCV